MTDADYEKELRAARVPDHRATNLGESIDALGHRAARVVAASLSPMASPTTTTAMPTSSTIASISPMVTSTTTQGTTPTIATSALLAHTSAALHAFGFSSMSGLPPTRSGEEAVAEGPGLRESSAEEAAVDHSAQAMVDNSLARMGCTACVPARMHRFSAGFK